MLHLVGSHTVPLAYSVLPLVGLCFAVHSYGHVVNECFEKAQVFQKALKRVRQLICFVHELHPCMVYDLLPNKVTMGIYCMYLSFCTQRLYCSLLGIRGLYQQGLPCEQVTGAFRARCAQEGQQDQR